jgi:branched-chain amino acid transport system permease protein
MNTLAHRQTRAVRAAATVSLTARARWHPLELAFWLAALASVFLLPARHLMLSEIAILALLALSLDLMLGYAGIISLGHAAAFGFGAYAAGLFAKHQLINEPLLALAASGAAATLLGVATSVLVLRGSDLSRIMVTLGIALVLREIANRFAWLTGGADGLQGIEIKPLLGIFRFDMFGHAAYCYCLAVLFALFLLARRFLSTLTPQYWPFWIGLLLVAIVLIGRERIFSWTLPIRALAERLDRRNPRAPAVPG